MSDTLNSQQSAAVVAMHQFLEAQVEDPIADKFFLLEGGAGTGKTYAIAALISQLLATKNRPFMSLCAPTHKAVKVLRSTAGKWNIHNVDSGTIYSFLGLKMDYDDEGERVLKEGHRSTIGHYELMILDEASMVSTKLWTLLQQAVKYRRTKFILMGDRAQLPPVNEAISPVFGDIKHRAELTQIMRRSEDNPIGAIIDAARMRVFQQNSMIPLETCTNSDLSKGVWVLDRDKWIANVIKAFQSPKYQEDGDFAVAIAWRNRTVDRINEIVRNALYDCPKDAYVIGERLVAREPVLDPIEEEIIINTGTMLTVVSAKLIEDTVYAPQQIQLNCWKLKVMDEDGIRYTIKCLDPSSQSEFDKGLKRLAAIAHQTKDMGGSTKDPWRNYWALKNCYAILAAPYAITAHRSQGSTFKNVFPVWTDLAANPNPIEKWQSIYVATSRASERLVIAA